MGAPEEPDRSMMEWSIQDNPDDTDIQQYIELYEQAQQAVPTAEQSHFHVRAAARTSNNHIVTGANHEKALEDGVTHAEESLIAAAIQADPNGEITQLLIISETGHMLLPCGNCRDAIREYCPNTQIICAQQHTKTFTVLQASQLFNEDFAPIDTQQDAAFEAALQALRNARTVTEQYSKTYGACLCTPQDLHPGVFIGTGSFTPTNPIAGAISHNVSEQDTTIPQRLVIVATTDAQIYYKDRQALSDYLRTHHQIRKIPVIIHYVDEQDHVASSQQTNTQEWLPFTFELQTQK